MKKLRLRGVVPALITPVNEDESVDVPGLNRLLEFQVRAGVGGIFILGSCGEFATLRDKEHVRVIRTTVKKVAGRVPVIVGAADTGTARVLERVRAAGELGADGAVVLPPYYYAQNDLSVIPDFFADVARAATLPVVCYQNPFTTKIRMPFKILKQISRIAGIAGIKDSSCDLRLVLRAVRELQRRDFFVFTGTDAQFDKVMLAGAAGVVSGIASAIPHVVVNEFKAARRRDLNTVRREQEKITAFSDLLGNSGLAAIKYGAALQGLCRECVCRPQAAVSGRSKRGIKKLLTDLGYVRM